MRDKFTDVIRVGKVSSINPKKCTAKVTFEDRDNTVSGDLFITVPYTLKDKAYYMPSLGERVRVLFDPEAPSKGCILGSYYADTRLPPFGDENKRYVLFDDDTLIEYDKRLHTLKINVVASGEKSVDIVTSSDVSIKSNRRIIVESASDIEVRCTADITIKTEANIIMRADANLTIEAASNMKIKSSGDMHVESEGELTLKGTSVKTIETQ